jgi:hypothetical protein
MHCQHVCKTLQQATSFFPITAQCRLNEFALLKSNLNVAEKQLVLPTEERADELLKSNRHAIY